MAYECLVCKAADPKASEPFCCEECYRPDALTVACLQCDAVSHYRSDTEIGALALSVRGAKLARGHVMRLPYCSGCIEIVPARPIGEIEVYGIA